MRDEYRALAEFIKLRRKLLDRGAVAHHCIGYAGQLDHLFGYHAAGVDQFGELGHFLAVFDAHRSDLGYHVCAAVKAGRLHVEHDKCRLNKLAVVGLVHYLCRIFY